jgi:dihydrofolate reductase
MQLSIIVAMDQKGVIGINNTLPWRLSADLKNFKAVTMGKPIIMGRKTWESIGKPLPGRDNIIITRNPDYTADGATVFHSLDEALERYHSAVEVVIIGGHDIFKAALEQADRLYLTEVLADVEGDTWFPVFDRTEWKQTQCQQFAADEKNEYPFRFTVLERVVRVSGNSPS